MPASFDLIHVIAGALTQIHVVVVMDITALADFLLAHHNGVGGILQRIRLHLLVVERRGVLTERSKVIVPPVNDISSYRLVRLDISRVHFRLGASALL